MVSVHLIKKKVVMNKDQDMQIEYIYVSVKMSLSNIPLVSGTIGVQCEVCTAGFLMVAALFLLRGDI